MGIARINLHIKILAEVELSTLRVLNQKFARALGQNRSLMEEVGAIHDGEGLAHIVVGNKDTDPTLF